MLNINTKSLSKYAIHQDFLYKNYTVFADVESRWELLYGLDKWTKKSAGHFG